MKFFFFGLLLGILLAFVPLVAPHGGFVLSAEWYGNSDTPDAIQPSPSIEMSGETIPPLKSASGVHLLNASGALMASFPSGGKIIAPGAGGEYLALYEQAGKYIEFFNIKGDRFWKINSLEYPFLSSRSKIILLLNGDHSAIRLVDFNGNPVGVKYVSGRFCSTIAFSKNSDFSSAGFLDGNYYLFDEKGNIVHSGNTGGAMIKSMAISQNGHFLALHSGWGNSDRIRLIDIARNTFREKNLRSVHHTRMPLHIRDDGSCAYIDAGKITVVNRRASMQFEIDIPMPREGHASIDFKNDVYTIAYPLEKGGSNFFIIRKTGEVLFVKKFEHEEFLDCAMGNTFILVKGMKNLYCYSYHNPAIQ